MGNYISDSRNNEGEFPLELYESEKFLGRGGFGTVYRYRIKQARNADQVERPEVVAVKLISLTSSDKNAIKCLEREFSIAKSLSHTNIVRFIGRKNVVRPNSLLVEVNLVMEHCQIDLKQLLGIRNNFSSNDVAIIVKQILQGLRYLHHNNIMHRDIKPGNVLCLTGMENPVWDTISVSQLAVKLADFGLAKMFEGVRSSVPISSISPVGTRDYCAPEVLEANDGKVPVKSHFVLDSYSVGVLTFQLVTGNVPTSEERELLDNVDNEKSQIMTDKLLGDNRLVAFLQSAMAYCWRDRHTMSKLLEHDFVREAPEVNVLPILTGDQREKGKINAMWLGITYGQLTMLIIASAIFTCLCSMYLSTSPGLTDEERKMVDNDLWQAANDGNVACIKSALDRGADIEFKMMVDVTIPKANGEISLYRNPTPLIVASARGHLRAVECLISHGSNVDTTDDFGQTALMAALTHGHDEVISVLIDREGAEQENKLENEGWSALVYPTDSQQKGKSPKMELDNGKTTFYYPYPEKSMQSKKGRKARKKVKSTIFEF